MTIDRSPTIPIYAQRSGRRIGTARPGGAPHDIAFDQDGRAVWVSNWSSGRLTEISAVSSRQPAVLQPGREVHHFVFGLGCVWASDNATGRLLRIDPSRRRVLARVPVGAAPHHATVAGAQALVAVHGTGRVAIVSAAGSLLRSIAVGAGPHGIAAVPPAAGTRASCG